MSRKFSGNFEYGAALMEFFNGCIVEYLPDGCIVFSVRKRGEKNFTKITIDTQTKSILRIE